jgi:hypothetical protein
MMLHVLHVWFLHPAVLFFPQWFWHPLGYCASAGNAHAQMLCKSYNFWSGIESAIPQVAFLGMLAGFLKHLNCDAPRCPRYGPHRTADGHHKLCRKHHPDLPPHKLDLIGIHLLHHQAKAARGIGYEAVPGQDAGSSEPRGSA